MYSYSEVYAETLKYFGGDELATGVCINKYLLRDKEGNLLEKSPEEMITRLVREFFRIEQKYPCPYGEDEIYKALDHFRYIIPGGSPLFGMGNDTQISSLSNCFVADSPQDSYSSIIQTDENLVNILKRRGGCGIDMSNLRPAGSKVRNSAMTSDGVICFMERYSNTTKEVAQSGRRGALMLSIDCRHPDVERVIQLKCDKTKCTGANISIKWHDDFMEAVAKDTEYTLRFPVDAPLPNAPFTKVVKARELWKKFVRANWESAEPGCLFWDKMLSHSLSDLYDDKGFKTISTNPCGELALSAWGTCILTALNLASFVDNPYTPKSEFNFKKFDGMLRLASHLIDDLVDLELEKIMNVIKKIKSDPEPEDVKARELGLWVKVLDTCRNGRRVGLGITGLADTLASLGMKYDSEPALFVVEKIFKFYHETLMLNQSEMARQRDKFSCYDYEREKDSPYVAGLPEHTKALLKQFGRRNISMTTIAPAGSISLMIGCSSGIEPVFALNYTRRRKLTPEELSRNIKPTVVDTEGIRWTDIPVTHHGLVRWRLANPGKKDDESPFWKCQASELKWINRVKIQSTIQKYITHSISSTLNLPSTVTEQEISDIYVEGWKNGCKGLTIYREGSRDGILVNDENRDRPKVLECDIQYSTIEEHQWIFFVGLKDGRPYEIFGGTRGKIEVPKKYKKGWIVRDGRDEDGLRMYDLHLGSLNESEDRIVVRDIASAFSNTAGSYTRLISLPLKTGTPVHEICEALNKDMNAGMYCFEKGVARVLKKYIKDGTKAGGKCEQCSGETFQYRDGCKYCSSCGFSKCA